MKKLLLFALCALWNIPIFAETGILEKEKNSTTLRVDNFKRTRGDGMEMDPLTPSGYYVGEKAKINMSVANLKDTPFEGKFAIAAIPSFSIAEEERTEYTMNHVMYSSPLNLEVGESYTSKIELKELVSSLFDEIKPEDEAWAIFKFILLIQELGQSKWSVVKNADIRFDMGKPCGWEIPGAKDFFINGNLKSPQSAAIGETFTVKVPIYSYTSETPNDNFEIGIFKREKIHENAFFTFNYFCTEIISKSLNGDEYTCEISQNVQVGEYFLFP